MTDDAKSDISMSSVEPAELMGQDETGVPTKMDEVTALQDSIGACSEWHRTLL